MQQPAWATNTDKFNRALAWVTEQVKSGVIKEVTEEAVKDRYVALRGLVAAEKQGVDTSAGSSTLEDMTVPQLKKRAAETGIDISAATSKSEIIATIREIEDAD